MSRAVPETDAGRAKLSPLMIQYARIKHDVPDAFLFFRLGDFYEMFQDDAVRGAALLGLTLTSRNKQDPEPIPMCGIPWHQRDAYVVKLLRLGHKVAICDQLEDPAQAKGIVQRGVTEILTPGSVTADTFLDPAAGNFLAALWPGEDRVGVCLADVSTGEVRFAEPAWEDVAGLLARARVAEWLTPPAAALTPATAGRLAALLRGMAGALSERPVPAFLDRARIAERWGEAGGLNAGGELALGAGSAALEYLDRVQGAPALRHPRFERWGDDGALRVDAATARHLELFEAQPGGEASHTLWHHLNLSVTAPGARRLRSWLERPLTDREVLNRRLDAVGAWLAAAAVRRELRERMKGLPDLERLTARLAAARSTPRDLGALRDTLGRLPALAGALESFAGGAAGDARAALDLDPALAAELGRALTDDPPPVASGGGVIRAGFDARRDQLDALAHSGKRWIAELEIAERARTGIASLKVGFNRVFGYYLEVTRAHLERVPADWERRQTLTGAERFVTPALKQREEEVLSAEDKLKAREHELFVALRGRAAGHVTALQAAAAAIAQLDAEAALAEAAARYRWTRPELEDSDRLHLEQGRHPVVERLTPGGSFVPNDCRLDGAQRQILLLTGPNMGGKSTYLRQVALTVLLAQSGSFVPAARARIGLVDRLFTRVGAADRLGAGHSTFMVEMTETAEILRASTPRSLVLLDEVGRGTSTYDGLALAWAVTEHLHAAGGPRPRTIFATHYHELTQLAGTLPRLANVHVAVKEWGDGIVFLHRIADGAADRSYGIHVAQLAGLPESVLARARAVLAELESERTADHLAGGAAGERRKAAAALPLFETASHPVAEALSQVDPDRLTPIEALKLLVDWKQRFGGGGAGG